MPPKRTPTKVITPKSKKDKTPKVIMPEVRVRDSSVESTASNTAPSMPAGISPDFLAYIQMQDRIRAEEKQEANRLRAEEKQEAAELRAILEAQRKDDLERAEAERYAMNKAHENQLKLLQDQLEKMSSGTGVNGPKSSSKMPTFCVIKDKSTFKLWKSRWDVHIQGHNFNKISDTTERNIRLKAELNSCLSDDTLNWLLNNNFSEDDLAKAEFVLQAIELKVNESSNPLIQQIEMAKITQQEHETGDHLVQRIRDISSKCAYEKVTNVQDHLNMITLLKAVKPNIRKKMLLQKVDTFDKAIDVLLSEEHAATDSKLCTETKDAAVFATSTYKRSQREERQGYVNKPVKEPCHRCTRMGHSPDKCWAKERKCDNCDEIGHLSPACKKEGPKQETKGSGFAHTVRAHVETLTPNEAAIFNASQIEKAEHCGLVYNVQKNDIEDAENMTRHQRFGMFGHLIK